MISVKRYTRLYIHLQLVICKTSQTLCMCVCVCVCLSVCLCACTCVRICVCAHEAVVAEWCEQWPVDWEAPGSGVVLLNKKLLTLLWSTQLCSLARDANAKLIVSHLRGWVLGGTLGAHTVPYTNRVLLFLRIWLGLVCFYSRVSLWRASIPVWLGRHDRENGIYLWA